LRTALLSLKSNKSAGSDKVSVNILKLVYDIIEPSLFHIFNQSLKSGKVPEKLKIARVTPVFKSGDESEPSNYRPISVLSCFSKLLERIVYNRLYNHLTENNMLYSKQFGFKKQHSTDHAIVELVNHLSNAFKEDYYTLGAFIDLSKAFDTVNHSILIKKLEYYGIKETNLLWFESYLSNRKQYVQFENLETTKKTVNCGVPQGSILGPLLFLLYINDLSSTSNLLNFILFADDSNLFYSHKNIETLFTVVNEELKKVNEWFICNKLSLNVQKTKFSLFHKPSKTKEIPFILPNLLMNKTNIKRQISVNFLGVNFDEKLSWKVHINSIEKKISKSIGMIYRVKPLLNFKSLKSLYFSFIHSYLTYGNIVWASTNYTKLKKLYSKQKHAVRIIFGSGRAVPCEPLLRVIGALNIFKLNIHLVLLFMYKTKYGLSPKIFETYFKVIHHKYATRFSANNFVIPKSYSKQVSYSIQNRGPLLWKRFPNIVSGKKKSLHQFKTDSKQFFLNADFDLYYYKSFF
jgi:hypothetical protein